MTTGPYRDTDALLLCPGCGDVLVSVFDAVRACPRCVGVWVPQSVIDRTFRDPLWPRGPGAWWRRSRECPECQAAGTPSTMNATSSGTTVVDRCGGHGVFFDAGELRHLLDSRTSDLVALHAKVVPGGPPLDESWRVSVQEGQRAALLASYRARQVLIQEQAAAERAAAERAEAEKARAEEAANAAAKAKAAEEHAAWLRKQQEALALANARHAATLTAEYREAMVVVDRLEAEVVRLRNELRDTEEALSRARARASHLQHQRSLQ